MNLWIQEDHINVDQGYSFGGDDAYETFTDNRGELYRSLVKEHGRCISKMYVDLPDGGTKVIGWVFQKRDRYEDSNEPFLHETWVSVQTGPPTRTIEHHYA